MRRLPILCRLIVAIRLISSIALLVLPESSLARESITRMQAPAVRCRWPSSGITCHRCSRTACPEPDGRDDLANGLGSVPSYIKSLALSPGWKCQIVSDFY